MGEIRKNRQVKLFFKTVNGSEQELNCSIKEVYSDRISLNFPEETMYYLDYLGEGSEVKIQIFTPLGLRLFDALIINSPSEPEFIIEFIENYIEIQRRKYLRAPIKTKLIIEKESGTITTHTLDIGGGGISFFYEGFFQPKEEVNCMLVLPQVFTSVKARGRIIKSHETKKNEHVLFFIKIEESERNKIIKKCMEYVPD